MGDGPFHCLALKQSGQKASLYKRFIFALLIFLGLGALSAIFSPYNTMRALTCTYLSAIVQRQWFEESVEGSVSADADDEVVWLCEIAYNAPP